MRSALAGSLALHAAAIGALFVTHPATTVVLPGPDVVQVSLVDVPSPTPAPAAAPKAPPPAPPAPKPDADRGVRIEPRPRPAPPRPQPPPPAPAKPAAAPARQAALPLAPAGAGVSMQVAVDQTDFEFAYYLQAVRTAIGQAWAAPAGAASGARCTVYFRIGRDGSIEAVRLEAGSGNGFFDQAAVRAVVVTAKLPPLPLGYTGADLGIHLDFVYTGP